MHSRFLENTQTDGLLTETVGGVFFHESRKHREVRVASSCFLTPLPQAADGWNPVCVPVSAITRTSQTQRGAGFVSAITHTSQTQRGAGFVPAVTCTSQTHRGAGFVPAVTCTSQTQHGAGFVSAITRTGQTQHGAGFQALLSNPQRTKPLSGCPQQHRCQLP